MFFSFLLDFPLLLKLAIHKLHIVNNFILKEASHICHNFTVWLFSLKEITVLKCKYAFFYILNIRNFKMSILLHNMGLHRLRKTVLLTSHYIYLTIISEEPGIHKDK